MATYYVRSTDGDDASDGLSWANAKATLAGAEAIPWASGDTVYVSQSHAESTAAAITIDLPTTAPGIKILCGNDAAEPPTALATTGTVTTTGTNAISISGYGYIYGLTFSCGTGAGNATFNIASPNVACDLHLESCVFQLTATGAVNDLFFGSAASTTYDNSAVRATNCTVKFGATGHSIVCRNARVIFSRLAIDSAGSTPTTLIVGAAACTPDVTIENSDLSGEAFTNLVDVSASAPGEYVFRNCKLPASVAITTGTNLAGGTIVTLDNCDSGDTNYRFAWHSYEGSVVSETTIVRTGGATDGTTTISWEMVSSADATFFRPLRSDLYEKRIAVWNETTGSAVTATVECVTDNVTLTNADAWIEVEYLGTAGVPQGSVDLDDRAADILATPANQTSSSETWTTTGLTTPVKQKFAATFTPQEKGWVMVTVCLAKASTTVYVDPKITLS